MFDDVSEGHQADAGAASVAVTAVDRASVLGDAAQVLLSSLEVQPTLVGVAQVMSRYLADWCTVVTLDDEGAPRRTAWATADPSCEEAVRAVTDQLPPGTGPEAHVGHAIATGRSQLVPRMSPDGLDVGRVHSAHALLRHVGLRSVMVVPMVGRGRAVGAVTLVRGDYRDPYGADDLALAEEIARLGGLAVENAEVHESLAVVERRFRSFVDSLGAIVWEADPDTLAMSFVSRRAEDLLGFPVERWLHEPGFWASKIHPADRDYTVSYRRVATSEGRDHELEYRMVAADGRKVWFQDLVFVDVGEDGRPQRLVGIMVDVTRRKRAELVLLESRQRFASLARTLQASLLPPHLPDIAGLDVAARYRSAEDGLEVVGDFYDLFDLGAGAGGGEGWGVVIGDVCGKGPEAAALTAVARHTVRAAAMREPRPSGVLSQLNDAVLNQDAGERFCTALYARVLPGADGVRMSLSCGGHPLPLVLRADGSVEAVGSPGTLLGLFEEPDLVDTDVELAPGDAAIFFTDGATEAKRRRVLLGENRLRAIVSTCTGLRAAEIAHRLEDAILAFQEENGPNDDLAIVVLRVPEAAGP
ncbi:MAG: SpoIIE family protein phosphatase [Actinomycetota bacterium]|nr:SpoIIE family protein phosphatase [Actinomycetota bacterium]